jgi:hypothetical protein
VLLRLGKEALSLQERRFSLSAGNEALSLQEMMLSLCRK